MSSASLQALLKERLAQKKLPKEELVEVNLMLDALNQKEADERLKNYTPNGKCAQFIAMVGRGETFISLMSAGNAVGKTTVAVNILGNLCFHTQNEWFEYPLYEHFPYPKLARIVSDPATIKEKIVPEIEKWFPMGKYTASKEGKPYYSKFVTNTGWTLDIMTYEQRPKEFESVERGFVWMDEPPPKAIFNATISRGRKGMVMCMTMTPLKHAAWVKDEIVDQADKEEALNKVVRTQRYITANVEDACIEHGVRGHLKHEHIQQMISKYPPDEIDARTKGTFAHLVGRVHKLFDKQVHVLKPFALKQKDYAIYHFLDPHPRTPDAACWYAVDRNNQVYQIAELWMQGSAKELAYEIKSIEKKFDMRVEGRWIDPSAYTEDQHIETSLHLELAQYDLHYQPGSKDLEQGITLTDEALHFAVNQQGVAIQKPKFFIFDTCVRTLWEFDNYIWDEWRARDAYDKNPKPKPKDANDHMMENLHRAFLAGIAWQPI